MRLIIMRHGQAESMAPQDSLRQLTEKGRRDVSVMVETLRGAIEQPLQLHYSPFVRTTETAEIVANSLVRHQMLDRDSGYFPCEDIACGADLTQATSWLRQAFDECADHGQSLLMVSHQPLVSRLVSWLVEGASAQSLAQYPEFDMYPASAAVLELESVDRGTAAMLAMHHA